MLIALTEVGRNAAAYVALEGKFDAQRPQNGRNY